ncbi:MAG: hypothetical protein FJ293_05400 [Planctomycetes bacterium]|nr:hypothetical protein [Planctomycetota bacterium]
MSRLAGLFRSKSDLTTLRQLERAGVRSVNVLDLGRLEQLVGEAMESALREALSTGGSAELAAGGAQVEFLRRLGLHDRLADHGRELEAQSATLAGQRVELEGALRQSRAELDRRRQQEFTVARQRLQDALDALLGAAFDSLRTAASGSERLAAEVERQQPLLRSALLALLEQSLRTDAGEVAPAASGATAATAAHEAAERERLERRVRKLSAQLLETEELLARTRAAQAEAPGVPSVHRTPQGLAADAQDRTAKKSLLAAIFEHNLELRRTLAEPRPAAVAEQSPKTATPGADAR